MVDNPKKKKRDSKRLSKQPHERRYLADECKDFLKECKSKGKPRIISDEITITTVKKLARYYLSHYRQAPCLARLVRSTKNDRS